jgi:hypothetical protein
VNYTLSDWEAPKCAKIINILDVPKL